MDVSDLAEMLERHRAATGVVGAAIGIAVADRTMVATAGHATIEPSAPVSPATRFHVVSVTKVMVATVVTRLVAGGAWSIDDSLARYVPEVRSSSWSSDVTLRHLLANTGGIPERDAWDQDFDADGDDCLAKIAAEIGTAGALRRPNALWAYTNLGWCLLGRAIEVATGLTFEDAMRRELFEPLEMGATVFHHEGPIDPASLAFESSGADPQVEVPWNRRALGPAGGTVWSTVDDLLSLARVHLRDGVVESGARLTPPGILAGMRASHAEPRIPDWLDGWGLGLGRWDWPRATAFGWDGVGVGFRAFLRFIPELSAAIVLLTNTSTGRKLYRSLLRELLSRLGGPELPPDRFDVTEMPAEWLRLFAGAYGIPDRTVVVHAMDDSLRIDGMEGVSVVRPLHDGVFLVDPDGADVRTVVFAPDGPDGLPLALYDLVWALPRLGS